jgi:hypothetical protein
MIRCLMSAQAALAEAVEPATGRRVNAVCITRAIKLGKRVRAAKRGSRMRHGYVTVTAKGRRQLGSGRRSSQSGCPLSGLGALLQEGEVVLKET